MGDMVTHFTKDITATKLQVADLNFPMRSTFTSGALEMARSEIVLGRPGVPKTVMVVTDGIPISRWQTTRASRKLKKVARVMFAPVRMNRRGVASMRRWATSPAKD